MKKGFPIRLTIDEAIEVFSKPDIKPFSKDKLKPSSFNEIKTFKDAVRTLGLNLDWVSNIISEIEIVSKATAAMFKLNIIKKALNLNQDLRLTKEPKHTCIYYPCNQLVIKNTTYYVDALYSDRIDIIGKIRCEGSEYYVIGGEISGGGNDGLGGFCYRGETGDALANVAFLGCASDEIAKHFGKYFGMLITEAKFGDLPDFEVI